MSWAALFASVAISSSLSSSSSWDFRASRRACLAASASRNAWVLASTGGVREASLDDLRAERQQGPVDGGAEVTGAVVTGAAIAGVSDEQRQAEPESYDYPL